MSPLCVLGIAAGLCLLTLILAILAARQAIAAEETSEAARQSAATAKRWGESAQAAAGARQAEPPAAEPGRIRLADAWYDEEAPEKFE